MACCSCLNFYRMNQKIKIFFTRHYLAILFSILVGLIYIWPHVWFIASNSDIYQGIPLMQIDNEDFYLARMQEILDGHPSLGSPAFFEYKDQPPMSPPTVEILYALPTIFLGIPLIITLTASKFILPLVLFLLIYSFIFSLLGRENNLANKISSIAGAALILLGYDLIDYRYIFNLLSGSIEPSRWLIWTRPVNPITGAIFLFSFLLFLKAAVCNTKKSLIPAIGAGFFLALMFSSYFFSWGIALSILAMMGFFYILRRNYYVVKRIILISILGIFLSLPYWYSSWQAKQNIWYDEALLKSGLFYTHYPLFNKVLIVSFLIYLLFLLFKFFNNSRRFNFEDNDYFILALLTGGLFAFNQQVITGMTVWPFHFVQYTIPFSIIAGIIVLHNITYKHCRVVWLMAIGIIILASSSYGIYIQFATYSNYLEYNKSVQDYAALFKWINSQEKDCVVLVAGDRRQFKELSGLVLAFTHCNQYSNEWAYTLMPSERVYHNYLVNLRMKGISADGFEEYLQKNFSEARSFLFSNWAGLYGVSTFPDFTDEKLQERIKGLPGDYHEFLKKDFKTELNKYRLDFIISFGPLSEQAMSQLSDIKFLEKINNLFIYEY